MGITLASCFSKLGHSVTAYDKDAEKMRRLAAGDQVIYEKDIDLREVVFNKDISETEVAFVCVGTPLKDGTLDVSALEEVAFELDSYKGLIVVRSTVPPGTTERIFSRNWVAYNPEFLREGTAVADFFNPGKLVFGVMGQDAANLLNEVYGRNGDVVGIREAEMVKFVDNAWHALKVVFANEIGSVCRDIGVKASDVMRLFKSDRKLNISDAYLTPGFAFGGSCLNKDPWALVKMSKRGVPLIRHMIDANEHFIADTAIRILDSGVTSVGLLGITFKEGTDDLRDSPWLKLKAYLEAWGIKVSVYDKIHGGDMQAVSAADLVICTSREYDWPGAWRLHH